jgi:hypothetical protein
VEFPSVNILSEEYCSTDIRGSLILNHEKKSHNCSFMVWLCFQIRVEKPGMMAHACNPSYLDDWGEDHSLRTAQV